MKVFAPLMWVRCFAVDGLLIDSGLYSFRSAITEFARERRVEQAALTHHHEDHTNNADNLRAAGVQVRASAATAERIAGGFETYFYQRRIWGVARPARVEPLPEVVETARHRFEVIPAPGHCEDQIVLYERQEGWLFSGDAFLASKIKVFRRDEDFAQTLGSLRRLVQLDFEALFCAHRPVPAGGRAALAGKLQHLLELEGQIREMHARGVGEGEIARRLFGSDSPRTRLLTWGDASGRNLVRSVLRGPTPRPG